MGGCGRACIRMLISQALSCTCTNHSPYFHTQVASTTDDMPSKVLPSAISYSIHLLLPTILVLLRLSSSSIYAFHASTPDGQKTNVVFVIDEESPVGSRIGSLAEKLGLDITSRGEVNFVPLTDLRLVNFNRTSGLITVKQRIDREGLCKEIGACCPGQSILPTSPPSTFHDPLSPDVQYSGCAIKMLVMDQRQRNSNTPLQNQEHPLIQVVIYVNDLNDNPPFWSPDKLELEIPEHTVIGRKFQLPEATDPDHGPEYTVQNYRLIPSEPLDHDPSIRGIASDAFELTSELIERTPGSPYKFSLGLKVKADLDREKQSAYYFLLIATDGGSPQLTGTLSVIVRITDINDQTPYFRQNNPSVEISENITPVQRLFTIDSRTDAKDSMYNSNSEYGYIIPIEVTDQAHIAETKLRVHVLNANDNHPVISIQSPLQNSASKATITISDADERGGKLHPTIRNLFKLVTSKLLDHETKSTHGITITCYDSGQPVLDTKKHITVRLEDVNDSPPVFEKSIYYARISEGLPVHTPIIKVHASDTDTGEMEVHQMDYDPMVILDEKTGQIRSGKVFDREVMKSFNFTIEAVDWRINTATAEVIVQIEDINDCAPEFDQQSYEFIIQECHISKILVSYFLNLATLYISQT
ncbi:unnamed protein product [Hymenolepis diminuta]|uniref:Cadherin domain-containing protein n=1 Tax=Hymenolepis diminuta TaxID=6216 RepID=A0A0R3SQA6_HYMDI|nr:unnamed protein product [Hymenolepis diminuta]